MRITNKLALNAVIPICLALAAAGLLVTSQQRVDRARADGNIVRGIVKGVFELNVLTQDYLHQHGERSAQQWMTRHRSLEGLLSESTLSSAEAETTMESIRQRHNAMKGTFSLLTESHGRGGEGDAPARMSAVLERRLTGQLMAVSTAIVSDAFRLVELSEKTEADAQRTADRLMLVGAAAAALAVSLISLMTGRSIVRSLHVLRKGTGIIAAGDLGHRIDMTADDETGELASAFNDMAASLQESNAGLQREIAQRREAEGRILHLNAVLRAIRNVDQLITHEKDGSRLLQGACEHLTEARSYSTAWVAQNDAEGQLALVAHSGSKEDLAHLEAVFHGGEIPPSAELALQQEPPAVSHTQGAAPRGGESEMAARLERDGYVYGVLVVSSPTTVVEDHDEQTLFHEMAGDLAFALWSLQMEEERARAVAELEEHRDHLEELVTERTARLEAEAEEHRRARETIERLTRQNELILNAAGEGIWGIDAGGRTSFVNAAGAAMLGRTVQEIIGESFHDLACHADSDGALFSEDDCPICAALRDRDVHHGDAVVCRGDGEQIAVAYTSNALQENDRAAGAVAVIEDISERKAAEQALQASEARFRDLFDDAPVGYHEIDASGRIVRVNNTELALFGYAREEMLGRPAWRFADEKEESRESVMAKLGGAKPVAGAFERTFTRKDGTRFAAALRERLLRDPTGRITGIQTAVQDISELRTAEEQLQRTLGDLQRSNTELEQFAYVASHDLQEPLRKVKSFVELLAQRYRGQLDERADRYINYAVDGAARMQGLIQDLLAFSRVGRGDLALEPTDLGELVAQVVHDLSTAINESAAEVVVDALPELPVNPRLVGLVFQNLIWNAIKFRGEEPPRVEVACERTDDGWLLSVKDNGIGIAPEYAERVFQIFQRLHGRGEYPGTGIGLAICKKIVERHGGRIWVESGPDKGSTFLFTIPV